MSVLNAETEAGKGQFSNAASDLFCQAKLLPASPNNSGNASGSRRRTHDADVDIGLTERAARAYER